MAAVIGNVYTGSNKEENTSGGFKDNNNLIVKDNLRDWYVYRATSGSVVKPYPVFDANGIPSPVVNNPDPENQYSVLSDAFAVLPLATYTGLDGKLQFVDYCSDITGYLPAGAVNIQTPFWHMVRALKTLLPNERTGEPPKSGLPVPQRLSQCKMNIHYSVTSILFRCAIMKAKGQPSKSKHAVDGIFFKGLFYIGTQSAQKSLLAELLKPRDPRQPWSSQNFLAPDLFDLDGVALSFVKSGNNNSDPLNCTFTYDQNYAQIAMKAFVVNDAQGYHAKLREMFGPCQRISDVVRLMTVQEMVKVMKEHFPMSWVYYGLKDSPFASLLTGADRDQALSDPEFAPCFGLADKAVTAAVNAIPQSVVTPSQLIPPPATHFQYVGGPAANAPQEPTWTPPGYGGTPQPAPAQESVTSKMDYYRQKYGVSGGDQLPM